MKKSIYYIILFQFISILSFSQEIIMSGKIIDSETSHPIEFVNIGVINKNKGTVSNLDGKFSIKLSKEFSGDSLAISHINYKTVKIPIKPSRELVIPLQINSNEMEQVVVTSKKKKKRKIGVKSHNPLLWLRAIADDNDIIENAQKIKIPNESTVRVKQVSIYLRRGFKSDSSFVRINFYENVNNAPGEKIVFENVLKNKKIEPGWLHIDLSEYFIFIEEDFFVGVEFLPDFKNPREVYIGAILTKGKGYNRRNSQGEWKKINGASTINVEVEY